MQVAFLIHPLKVFRRGYLTPKVWQSRKEMATMAITRQWQNLPHGHDENADSICAMLRNAGTMHVLPRTFHIAHCLRAPISREGPPSSG